MTDKERVHVWRVVRYLRYDLKLSPRSCKLLGLMLRSDGPIKLAACRCVACVDFDEIRGAKR